MTQPDDHYISAIPFSQWYRVRLPVWWSVPSAQRDPRTTVPRTQSLVYMNYLAIIIVDGEEESVHFVSVLVVCVVVKGVSYHSED